MEKTLIFLLIILLFSNFSNAQIFTEQTDIEIQGIRIGSIAWGDHNNDGLLDFIMTGDAGIGEVYYSAIYKNIENNSFEEYSEVIEAVEKSSLDWGDFSNNNYIDIIFSGLKYKSNSLNIYTSIYKNNTNNTFSEQINVNLSKSCKGDVVWGDYNNDAYSDILQTGYSYGDLISKIYENNKNNTVTYQDNISINEVMNANISWGDYNNDGLLDFVFLGTAIDYVITKIFKNNGNNSFSPQDGIELTNVLAGSIEWGDYDNDGYLDIVLSGQYDGDRTTKIYKNNGDETFTELISVNLVGVSWGNVVWGDYNNDGFLDILLVGTDFNSVRHAKIYRTRNINRDK